MPLPVEDLSPAFVSAANKSNNKFSKRDEAVLFYKTYDGGSSIYHYYDFVTRYLYVRFESKDHSHMIAFSDLDQETLRYMRDKLVELGGTPPPLAEKLRSAIQKKDLSC